MRKRILKISIKLHLWIALISGLITFIVCITGALYAFRDEITDLSQPWRFVEKQEVAFISPSEVLSIAHNSIEGVTPSAITYGEVTDAIIVDYYGLEQGRTTLFINPYTGGVIKEMNEEFDFFSFVLSGHRSLWLPYDIGRPIVGWSVVLFVIELLTGLVLWIPKRWKYLKNNFKIRRKRLNLDLHNTLGGIFLPLLLLICLTGLIWSFTWFSKVVYTLTGGAELKPYILPKSDSINVSDNLLGKNSDKLYFDLKQEYPDVPTIYMALPSDKSDPIRVSIVHKRNSYYQTDNLFFDQYTLKPLDGQGPYAGKYREVSTADKIRRVNLEIHDGRILGLFGKTLAFLTSVVGAMLYITGIIFWIKRKWKKHHHLKL